MHYLRNIEIKIKSKIKLNMRTHRKSNTENAEQKKTHQLNHDRHDLRQPRNGCQSPTVHVTFKLRLGWYRHSNPTVHDKVIGWTRTNVSEDYAQSSKANCGLDLTPSNMIFVRDTLSYYDDYLS